MSSILTVTQLNKYISSMFRSEVKLRGVAVKGEISNLSVYYRSGHMYFSIKDQDSVIRAVMFSSNVEKLRFMPEDGMDIIAFGNIEVYERDGQYQLVASDMQPMGVGAQAVAFEQLKKKLERLGVFSENAKRPIHPMPKKIAVVTSPNGAALQDIINIISRRCPICKVQVFPAAVQGSEAPELISAAIQKADLSGAETMIIARGGGSSEDLKAFNTEQVVMAVYNCSTPVISAVGHETDTSLADYAADLRVPTPSAAAEMAVPDIMLIYAELKNRVVKAGKLLDERINSKVSQVELLTAKLSLYSPKNSILFKISELERSREKLNSVLKTELSVKEKMFSDSASKIEGLSPFGVLERGYSIVSKDDMPIRDTSELSVNDEISIKFACGEAVAQITKIIQGEEKNDI